MYQTSTHRATFQQYIRAGVQASLARVQAAEHVVPEVDRQQAWHILSFALNVPEVWDVTRVLLLALAPKMELAGFRDEWLPYLEQGVQASQHQQDRPTEAQLGLLIGILNRLLSNFDLARQWLKASVDHFLAINDTQGQAQTLNELGWIDHLQHRYPDAIRHSEQALACLASEDPERGMSYRVQGMVAIGERRWQDAVLLHGKALKFFERQGSLRKIAWGAQNLGIALSELGQLQDAATQYQRAANYLNQMNDIQHWAVVQMNLGVTFRRLGNLTEALECHKSAQQVFERLHDKLFVAKIDTNLGLSYLALCQYEQASEMFLLASKLYAELGDVTWQLNAMDGMAMTYLAQNQYQAAIDILEQALLILPTIRDNPYYDNLSELLHRHLSEARMGQR